MINQDRIRLMTEKLTTAFAPVHLLIEDQSHLHVGHAGAKTGLGHFKLSIIAPAFAGKTAIECHRMIYNCLGDMMKTDIHALTIDAHA